VTRSNETMSVHHGSLGPSCSGEIKISDMKPRRVFEIRVYDQAAKEYRQERWIHGRCPLCRDMWIKLRKA